MANADLPERGLRDPQGVFGTPEAVVQSDQLTREHKRSILQRWQRMLGASGDQAAAGSGTQPNLATRLVRALSFLDTETGGHEVTHNQGFYTSIGDIGRGTKKE